MAGTLASVRDLPMTLSARVGPVRPAFPGTAATNGQIQAIVLAMLSDLRRDRILARLKANGEVSVASLVRELGCAPETVRRDLAALEARARLRRVHGGAVQVLPPDLPPVPSRMTRDRQAKDAVADAAVALVPAGALVFVGAGSTALALSVRLLELPSRTCFVTNMLDVAQVLARGGRHQVHLAGGEVNPEAHTTTGSEVLVSLRRWLFDLVIVGAAAVDARHGLLAPTGNYAGLLDTLLERSRDRMVLADSSKFTAAGRQVTWPWTAIGTLVTDRRPPRPIEQAANAAGTRLVVAHRP